MSQIGVAIVGYGPMGKLHAANVYANPSCKLVYIVGTKPNSVDGKALADRLHTKYSSSLAEVLADAAVEAVVVACPLSAHYDVVKAALQARKPVMCEKPLANSPQRIDELYALAEQQKQPLLTAFHRRFDANFAALKKSMHKAGDAEVLRLVALDPMEPQADVGVTEQRTRTRLYDSLLHDFDMAMWLLDETEVQSVAAVQARYDAIQVVLKFARTGTLVTVEWAGGTSFGYDQRVEVFGTKGLLQVDNPPLATLTHTGLHANGEPRHSHRKHDFFHTRYPMAYAAELAHFVELASGKTSAPLITRAQALASAHIAERVVAAIHHAPAESVRVPVPARLRDPAAPIAPPAAAAAAGATKPLGIALVGCGRMGRIRAEGMRKNARVSLLWVVDSDLPRAQQLATTFGAVGCRVSAALGDALADPAVGGVWISVPSDTHLPIIRAAAKAKKPIYTEKPVALTIADIDEAYALAATAGVPLCCGWNRRFDPNFRDLQRRAVLNDRTHAKAVLINNGDHPLPPVNVLLQLGSLFHDFSAHDFDSAVWLTGEFPCALHAIGNNFIPQMKAANLLDAGAILMQFPSGTIVAVTDRRCSVHGYDQRIEMLCDNGNLYTAHDVLSTSVEVHNAGGVQHSTINNTFTDRYAAAYATEVDHFADVVLNGAAPLTSHLESKAVALLADAAVLSLTTGKTVRFEVAGK